MDCNVALGFVADSSSAVMEVDDGKAICAEMGGLDGRTSNSLPRLGAPGRQGCMRGGRVQALKGDLYFLPGHCQRRQDTNGIVAAAEHK